MNKRVQSTMLNERSLHAVNFRLHFARIIRHRHHHQQQQQQPQQCTAAVVADYCDAEKMREGSARNERRTAQLLEADLQSPQQFSSARRLCDASLR